MKRAMAMLLAMFSVASSAGTQTGTVFIAESSYGASATSPGYLFFFINGGTKTGTPSCATINNGTRWVIDNSWPAAKSQLAILLMAAATGKRVTVIGSNNCSVWGDSETAVEFQIPDES